MHNRFNNKVIAIAGGSGGIGNAVSQRLADEGAIVMVGDINLQAAEQTVAEITAKGGRATPFKLDIGSEESIKDFVHTAITLHGGLDGFHVNALDASRQSEDIDLTAMDMSAYDEFMQVNQRGYFLCTRYAVPEMLKRGGGCMLYTSSGAAYIGMDTKPLYAMAKSAVHALARNVASRWGKQGIRGNVISPGLILHPAVAKIFDPTVLEQILQGVKTPRLGEPEDIAAMAALLLSDEGAFITGQVIAVDGGVTMRA